MTRVILFVVAVVTAVMAAVWFANEPGEVTVVWRGWRLDTSVGILLLLITAVTLFVLGIAKIISVIRGTAKGFAAARKERRTAQGLKALGFGLAAAHAGQPQTARKYAKEATALLHENAATQILNAKAAAANDDGPAVRQAALQLLEHSETELSGLRDLALRARSEGDVVGALNFAKRALARKDAPTWAFDLVLDVQIAGAQWGDALSTLESKAARGAYSADVYKKLKAVLLTQSALEALGHKDAAKAETQSHKAREFGAGVHALICHARALILLGKHKKAASEIEKAWATEPSLQLLAVYLDAGQTDSALDQARRVEKLVSENADHPESRLALAEASLRAQLWGQARNRVAPLLGDDVPHDLHRRAALLMAELETAERNDPAAGAIWFKRALDQSAHGISVDNAPRSVSDVIALKI